MTKVGKPDRKEPFLKALSNDEDALEAADKVPDRGGVLSAPNGARTRHIQLIGGNKPDSQGGP
jgi:hypothetical protein